MFTILSWNIQQGGGSRIRGIVQALQQQKASVVILSEFRNNEKGVYLRDALLKHGYRYQAVTPAEPQENSVLVASTFAFNSILHHKSDENFANNIVEAEFEAFSIFGVYLPHKKKHKLLNYMQNVIESSSKTWIIAGDYNTGINKIDQEGTSFWYQPEMEAFKTVGMIDTFRLIHNDAKEYSWYSHQGNGYRYDHTYISEQLSEMVTKCEYLHNWRESKLSDHSPMLLQIGE